MNNLTELDYAFIMCFKRSTLDNAQLLQNLRKAQSEWSDSPIEYITFGDVARMITGTVARIGILSTEQGMYRWFDCLRTEAMGDYYTEHDILGAILTELNIPENHRYLASFYIRYILNFADIIRWLNADDVPGLREYYEKEKV